MIVLRLLAAVILAHTAAAGDAVVPARGRELVRLPDGTCLLASGWDGSAMRSEVYRFDGTAWTTAQPIAIPRSDYSATLLRSGKVLLVGGLIGAADATTATAVLFDPATGQWTSAGSRSVGTQRHSATLLADGSVLVVGGATDLAQTPSGAVDRYDPTTNTWTARAALPTPRSDHRAVLLGAGRVLTVGGYVGGSRLATTEIYDPAANSWAPADPLAQGRHLHTANRLPDLRVMVIGGNSGGSLTSTEVFDPAVGTWSPGPSLGIAREGHVTLQLHNGTLLVIGGFSPIGELFDPVVWSWSEPDNAVLAGMRGLHAATLLDDGRVLTVGGYDGSAQLGTAESLGQAISFEPIPDKTDGDAPFSVSASSSSGLPITYAVLSGPATVAGPIVTLTGTGTVTIEARQAGDGTWFPASRSRSFQSHGRSRERSCGHGSLFGLLLVMAFAWWRKPE